MYALNLDTVSWKELYESACRRMAQLVPGWSDEIPSDPAVVLLELTSYLSAVQNREINRLHEQHYLAYLKLLGKSPRTLAPARLMAASAAGSMPSPGMRFEIDGVPFEVTEASESGEPQIEKVALVQGGRRSVLREDSPLIVTHDAPAELEITCTASLAAGHPVPFWLELQPEAGRVPPDEQTPPPICLTAQIWANGAWREVPCADGTCGLLRSGAVTLTPPVPSDTLRLTVEGAVEGEPRISAAALYPVTLEQRHTRSRYIDLKAPWRLPPDWAGNLALRLFSMQGDGWREDSSLFVKDDQVCGTRSETAQIIRAVAAEPDFSALHSLRELPGEEIFLEEDGILPDSLRLMIEENGLWYDCPVCAPQENRTLPRGCRWDASRRVLRFGDGRDFRIPAAGRVLVTGCVCTLGAVANGAGGILEQGGIVLRTLRPAWGGQDAEDGEHAFFRMAKELEAPARAVSLSDYETLARTTPGLSLDRVKAIPAAGLGRPGAGVVVLAKPRTPGRLPPLTPWQKERLRTWLEPFRMLGTPLEVRGPRYCPIGVRIRVPCGGPAGELRAAAMAHTDGVTGPLDFGAEISYTALYAALSAAPGVKAIRTLELRALSSGGAHRTPEGGIRLDADVLPYLDQFEVTEE